MKSRFVYRTSTSSIPVCLSVCVLLFLALFVSSCNALEMVYSVQTASVRENNNIYNRSPESAGENTFLSFFFFTLHYRNFGFQIYIHLTLDFP